MNATAVTPFRRALRGVKRRIEMLKVDTSHLRTRGFLSLPALRGLQVLLDISALTLCFFFAYLLRFEFALTSELAQKIAFQSLLVVTLQVVTLRLMGAYSFMWRYVGLREVRTFASAVAISGFVLLVLRLALPLSLSVLIVPLSVTVIDSLLAFSAVLSLRVTRRIIHERTDRIGRAKHSRRPVPVLLIGAGQAGVMAADEITRRGDTNLDIRGFIDDDPAKHGLVIGGVRVLGSTADLPALVQKLQIDHVVITIAQAPLQEIRRIVDLCAAVPIKTKTIPGLYELLEGRVEISRIRNIEIEDLLGRPPVNLDAGEMAEFLTGKTVMVTGAGGSIGSELARQVATFAPNRLLLVERAEFALFEIERELSQLYPELTVHPLVADTGDDVRMRRIFAQYKPHVVVHAAAHKHVPMMELQPAEAIKNNVLPTQLLGNIAGEAGAEAFILVSTDKAVNPTSVMGASKRVAELVVQDLSQLGYQTRFLAVRFGNVMGSAGSVIPIFRRQIAAGGPVTITHPEMKRYFMTIPEAAQLVLQAGAIGEGGEIFVLDMGEPVRIVDLALQMIRLSGLKPYEDIDVVFTGTRPGEKLFEEIDRAGEALSRTKHPKIYNGNLNPYPRTELRHFVERLESAARKGLDIAVRQALSSMIPEAALQPGSHPEEFSDLLIFAHRPVVPSDEARIPIRNRGRVWAASDSTERGSMDRKIALAWTQSALAVIEDTELDELLHVGSRTLANNLLYIPPAHVPKSAGPGEPLLRTKPSPTRSQSKDRLLDLPTRALLHTRVGEGSA